MKWETPPDAPNRRDTPKRIAEALRSKPGTWARVREYPTASPTSMENSGAQQFAYIINSGNTPAFQPAGSFEAVARRVDDNTAGVWARYVGVDK